MTGPLGTPPAIVQKLQEACMKALAKPAVVESLAKLGVDPAPLGPAELGAFIQAEVTRWSEMIREAGIAPE
jgi:tripartite-type tricarboxylate transporter receptor subunit TctC